MLASQPTARKKKSDDAWRVPAAGDGAGFSFWRLPSLLDLRLVQFAGPLGAVGGTSRGPRGAGVASIVDRSVGLPLARHVGSGSWRLNSSSEPERGNLEPAERVREEKVVALR